MPVAAIAYALISAALFGASTPFAKLLLGELPPLLLAGLLYLGSGLGLLAWIALRPDAQRAVLARSEWPWLGAAIVTGGVIAPALRTRPNMSNTGAMMPPVTMAAPSQGHSDRARTARFAAGRTTIHA